MKTLAIVGLLALATSASADSLKAARRGRVFKTSDGVEVVVVPLEPAGSKKVLVKISGTNAALDGRVFLNEINEWGENADYKTQWKGKPYVMITVRSERYEAYLPGVSRSLQVSYDVAKSEALKTDEIVKEYEAQGSSKP